LEDQQRVVYLATKGLLYYKLGQLESGEAYYNEASALAARTKNKKLQLLADFHHLLMRIELKQDEQNMLKLDRLLKELEPMDVVYLKDLVKNLLKRIDGPKGLSS
jgi:transcriptional antiterminator Rof (Rho-off)